MFSKISNKKFMEIQSMLPYMNKLLFVTVDMKPEYWAYYRINDGYWIEICSYYQIPTTLLTMDEMREALSYHAEKSKHCQHYLYNLSVIPHAYKYPNWDFNEIIINHHSNRNVAVYKKLPNKKWLYLLYHQGRCAEECAINVVDVANELCNKIFSDAIQDDNGVSVIFKGSQNNNHKHTKYVHLAEFEECVNLFKSGAFIRQLEVNNETMA